MPQTNLDYGKTLDWSAVSADYARHRNGYPASTFAHLKGFGIGLARSSWTWARGRARLPSLSPGRGPW